MTRLADWTMRLSQHPAFQRTVLTLILASSVLLGLETDTHLMASYGAWLKTLDVVLLTVFALEIGIRMTAHLPKFWTFFRDGWNVFDLAIVVVSSIPAGGSSLVVFRLLRVLRVLRLITRFPKLQAIISAFFHSMPSMTYGILILMVHFYIYGVTGVFLFGAHDPEHFGSLATSFLSLFMTLTLEGWVDLMKTQLPIAPFLAPLYFISFIIVGTMIILNLLIGVVVNSMAEAHKSVASSDPTLPKKDQAPSPP